MNTDIEKPRVSLKTQTYEPATDPSKILSDLVDMLLPGDDGWPSGSSVGVHGVLAMRISETMSKDGMSELAQAILSAGGPFEGRSEDDRLATVTLFSAQEPKLFEWIYTAAVLAYYEQPRVISAIQALGRPYSMRPHVTGYPLVPFDLEKDSPRHGRGHFLETEAVRPVDASQLNLDEIRTEHWGANR